MAVAITSNEMLQGVAMVNFNFPSSPANAVAWAMPDPMTNNYRYMLGRGCIEALGRIPLQTQPPANDAETRQHCLNKSPLT